MNQASFSLRGRNPDVLSCIANLSNDEVFTPPGLANQMLDTLADAWATTHGGANVWADKNMRFLDPFTKSGVFLREIVKRLTEGLASEIPDRQVRVDHILKNQVFGIGITRLTSLLARRTVYCSKDATGKHSIATSFSTAEGNIWFERVEHTWIGHPQAGGRRCKYCGASEAEYSRGKELETHAYAFLHTDDIHDRLTKMFGENMKFDVVIGNPPYQLNDGGGAGSSASPIYQKFIQQAQMLEPTFLTMVVPARWYSGGKGLDQFRNEMLADRRIRYLADYPDSRTAFDGVDVAGGVCYFLWSRDDPGPCVVETVLPGEVITAERQLDEFETFIRDNRALSIVHKIQQAARPPFSGLVSSRKPFGLESAQPNIPGGSLYLFKSGGDGKIRREDVPRGEHLINVWKVLLSKTSSEHAGQTGKDGSKRVFSRIEVMPPGSVATESYLVIGPFRDQAEATNAAGYLRTRFVRFLVSTILLTQNISKKMFEFVPTVDFSRAWSDYDLNKEFGLTPQESGFIEESIRELASADE